MMDRLASQQLTGGGTNSLSYLPDDQHRHGLETETVALLPVLRRLEVLVGGSGAGQALTGLRLLLEHLSHTQHGGGQHGLLPSEEADTHPVPLSEKIGKRFVEERGLQTVLTLLLAGTGNLENNPRPTGEASVKLRQLGLEVLCQLCLLNKEAPELLGETDELLIFCFHQLVHPRLYEKACQMIEHILMARRATLNLCAVPHLQKILARLEGGQLASFCKLLAVTVSDLDIFENKSSLYQQNIQKRSVTFIPVRDINQELVLSVPGFLSRLVEHASRLPYNPRFASTPAEIDHWMRVIDDHISDEMAVGEPLVVESYPGGGPTDPCSSLVNDLVDRVEVLYVLGLLLVGKHRKQVQKELAELQLIPKLSNLFDSFIWRSNGGRQRTRLPGHYHGCECSPEVALKIQFLRLVHSFCDHSDFKHLLMSRCEWDELGRIPPSANPACVQPAEGALLEPEPVPPLPDSRLMCRGTQGLLTKIVEVLKKEPTSSTFRFWLCRAVESYLRGGTSHADQIFLLRRGLLQHITASLIQTEVRQKETIQSSFDLLGEMVKFNYDACKQMDGILNSESKLKKGMIMVNNNLIDSNMFIRAMVLACDHFILAGGHMAEFAANSRLMKHFREFEKHVQFVVQLVSILNVTELTQENVSCLNTSLVRPGGFSDVTSRR
jgi:Trpc4-associated protein